MRTFNCILLSNMKHIWNFYWVCPLIFEKAGIYYKSKRILPIINFTLKKRKIFIEFINNF